MRRKITYIPVLLIIGLNAFSQHLRPESISLSYLGESVGHPGIKIGADFSLNSWASTKTDRKKNKEVLQKSLQLSPTMAFYFHEGYQKGIIILPEFSYSRKNEKGNSRSVGIGTGYLRTCLNQRIRHITNQ